MNPVLMYGSDRQSVAITPREYVDFLAAVFPVWWNHQHRYPHVQPFHNITASVRDRVLSLGCVESGACAYSYITVAPGGQLSHCGRAGDWGLLDYGSIDTRSFVDVMSDPQRALLASRDAVLRNGDCKDCPFWWLCHGGCPLDAWSGHQSFMRKSEWCEAKRGFITDVFEPVTGLSAREVER